jgi:PAS domain S-box-containing protein
MRRPRRPLTFETRIALLSFATGLPAALAALGLLWAGDYSAKVRWTIAVFVLLFWWGFAATLRERVVRPLQTLSNLLGALREGDFSLRARRPRDVDALAEVMREVNALGETLREQRLGAVEATALLHRVMEEVDVAIFTFDDEGLLRLVNRAGERLLAGPAERLLGRSAAELGLADCLEGEVARTLERTFPGGQGRWDVRRSSFRERGLPHQLLVISDLSQTLREEERQAWKRLIRVLGHELNNSLAPIRSMAGTLARLLEREPPPADWREDMAGGLAVIGDRSESLIRFMAAYSRLARLPPPQLGPVELGGVIKRAAALETRLPVRLHQGPSLVLAADSDQLEQLLINLIRRRGGGALADRRRRGRGEGRGRRAGARQHGKPLRALLHHEARRKRHRPGALAPDRRGARRDRDAGESKRPHRLPGGAAAAAVAGLPGAAQPARMHCQQDRASPILVAMNARRFVPTLTALALVTAGSAGAGPLRQPVPMHWTIDGVDREALVFAPLPLPAGVLGAKHPLVLAFHGHGGNMRGAALLMRLQNLWPEAIVVYPQGLPATSPVDPQGRRPGWQHEVGELGDRDLELVDAMLATLRRRYPVDDRRIYATGFSNGAAFSYLLWAARGKTFAAFAPVAGAIWPTLHLTLPRPDLAIGGESDPLVTLEMQKATLATVRALDGATAPGAPCGAGCTLYPSARNAPVEAIFHPGGHVYPLWVPARIVEFFKAHTAP